MPSAPQHTIHRGGKASREREKLASVVDIMKMGRLMEEQGFKNVIIQSEYAGVSFQLIGEGKIGLRKLKILVKNIKELNDAEIAVTSEEYSMINKKTKSHLVGCLSLYCLLADSVHNKAASLLVKKIDEVAYSLGSAMKEGGAVFMLSDCSRKTIYPVYPLITRWTPKYETRLRKIILELM
jgi:hypothetical protein